MAQPSGTIGTAVGDSNPGINPIRLQTRMKMKRREKRRVRLAVMADDLVALVEHESFNAFENMLQCPGDSTESRERTSRKIISKKTENQELHSEGVRDRRRMHIGLNVKHPQQCGDRPGEQVIQDFE